ncbi:excinuclease ABC subunit UvrA, partial [bacterium]|nr:excinuclease ABC subunit UvrA [bacterium]
GISGSGKSSLAFDTIYAEGQRRYIESLSTFAKQYVEQLSKPKVESIRGLSPSISIDQKTITYNPRSTVGTLTEIYDYVRLLYSRVGSPVCPTHKVPVEKQSPEQILKDIFKSPAGKKFKVFSPVARSQKGEFSKEFDKWARLGFLKARVDGKIIDLAEAKKLEKNKPHDIDVLVDRLLIQEKFKQRLADSIDKSISLSDGLVRVEFESGESKSYSIYKACPQCGYSYLELEPRMFSFNNPRGACEECNGVGSIEYEYEQEDGEIEFVDEVCEVCNGARLNEQALNVLYFNKNINELCDMSIAKLYDFFKAVRDDEGLVAQKIIDQLLLRLGFLMEVGTSYLSLNRPTKTLSGGEAQRIRLASQLGSNLIGVLYVLDEPSIGLHPRDHHKLINIIKEIKDRGNTILMVEHDADTMMSADHLIDIGPGAGKNGGKLMFEGTIEEILKDKNSLTGQYLSHKKSVSTPKTRREPGENFIELIGAKGNNLQNVDLKIPLNILFGVSGVSGSGKSSLIRNTLVKALKKKIYKSKTFPLEFDDLKGHEHLDKVIEINQKPIGRTPRSTPSTYVGIFPLIRSLYANLPEAKIRGYKPGHFSFNVKSGGRCEVCQGGGRIKLEMHFLSDVYVLCDTCQGRRYNSEILTILFREKSIADVLEMTVDEAADFFKNHKHIFKKLETLKKVGMGYISLGQSSTTLSGGEAQRVKLSRELSKRATGKTLYILDEPTTGLHFEDINKLIELLHELVDQGNSVCVVEHNLDVLKNCDQVVDMGPDGGDVGGQIVVQGTPEQVAKCKSSYTGEFLKTIL